MHMADAMVSPVVGTTMYVASGLVAAYAIKKLRKEEDFKKKILTMGVMGAFVFRSTNGKFYNTWNRIIRTFMWRIIII